MSEIRIKAFKRQFPPAEPAEPNAFYLVQESEDDPIEVMVTNTDGYLRPVYLNSEALQLLIDAAIDEAFDGIFDSTELTGEPTAPTAVEPENDSQQIANVEFVRAEIADGLDTVLESPEFTGIPKAPTADIDTIQTEQLATVAFVRAVRDAVLNAAPEQLNTLQELAAALGDDEDFANTMTAALAGKQGLNANLTAIAALATSAYGRSLLEAANAAALRTLAGLVIGTHVQAHDADLDAIAALSTTTFGRSLLEQADAAAARTALGVAASAPTARADLAADTVYNNTTAFANTGLSVSVEASGIYAVEVDLIANGAAQGIKADFNGGTATASSFVGTWMRLSPSPFIASSRTANLSDSYDSGATSGMTSLRFKGRLVVNGAGTFIMRAAQRSLAASDTTIYAGATMILVKLN